MKRPYYIFSNGRLQRHENTIYLRPFADTERQDNGEVDMDEAALHAGCVLEDFPDEIDLPANLAMQREYEPRPTLAKRPVPIEDSEAFYLFGEVDMNSRFFDFLGRHRIPLHYFNYFGFYTGSFFPRQEVNSGYLLVKQCAHYSDPRKRIVLARALVDGASHNILRNLQYYAAPSRGKELGSYISEIEGLRTQIATSRDVPTLMGIEGSIRRIYYSSWPVILNPEWAEFTRRVRRPPDNPINALISFANSLSYTLALSEIYRTPLSPLISYLHEPGARRFSLALDIAEIFLPVSC